VSVLTRQPSGVASLACGSRFTVALTRGGAVHSFGRNEDGQLGHGDKATQLAPRLVEALVHVRMASDCARGAHVLALEVGTGRVWSWGRGDEGQLGHGTTTSSPRPRPIASFGDTASDETTGSPGSSSAQRGSVNRGGSSEVAPAGAHDGGRGASGAARSDRGGAVRVVAVACGRQHSCALDDQGRLWTWGGGDDGALGHGDQTRQLLPKVRGEDGDA